MATDTTIPLPDGGTLEASVAAPAGPGAHPAVLVLHEIWGLNDDIRGVCDRFATAGYVALAPDLFSHGNRMVCLTRAMLSGDRALADIESARLALVARDDVDQQRVGVIGFCMGGGFALLFGARGGVRVASVNYGPVPRKRPAESCPVVASYGGRDLVFGSHGKRLEAHLDALGVANDVHTYESAGHSFMSSREMPVWMTRIPSPLRPGPEPVAAADAWARTFAFFGEHLPRVDD